MGLGGMVGRNDDRENDLQHLGRIAKSVFRRNGSASNSNPIKKRNSAHSKLIRLHQEVHKSKNQTNEKNISNEIFTLKPIKSLYKELTTTNSNKVKCNLLTPLFQNLFEGDLVYFNKVTVLITAAIILTEEGLFGRATKKVLISGEDKTTIYDQLPQTWSFQAPWNGIWFTSESVYSVYDGWTIWPDPELVKKVKELILSNRQDEALKITSHSLNLK